METRTIKVTLDKAKTWYVSGNPALHELALQAFTKKELEIPSYDDINQLVPSYTLCKETEALIKLSLYYRKKKMIYS